MMCVSEGYRRVKGDGSIVRYPNSKYALVNTTHFQDGVTEKYLTGDRPQEAMPYPYGHTDLETLRALYGQY